MIVAELAAAVAAQLVAGKRVVLLVGTAIEADEYRRAIEYLLAGTPTRGTIVVLCANANNGREWKTQRYDSVEVCPSAQPHPQAGELACEAAIRCTPLEGKPKPLDRELRRAIRQGRRSKAETRG